MDSCTGGGADWRIGARKLTATSSSGVGAIRFNARAPLMATTTSTAYVLMPSSSATTASREVRRVDSISVRRTLP